MLVTMHYLLLFIDVQGFPVPISVRHKRDTFYREKILFFAISLLKKNNWEELHTETYIILNVP